MQKDLCPLQTEDTKKGHGYWGNRHPTPGVAQKAVKYAVLDSCRQDCGGEAQEYSKQEQQVGDNMSGKELDCFHGKAPFWHVTERPSHMK